MSLDHSSWNDPHADAHWSEMEQRACDWMRANGFKDAHLTSRGADGGLDIISKSAVAQVKHHRKVTGAPAVQQLVGAAEGRRALLFSSSGFSKKATEFAERHGVALFQQVLGTGPPSVEALNSHAQALSRDVARQRRAEVRRDRRIKAATRREEVQRAYMEQHPDSWVSRLNRSTEAMRAERRKKQP